MKLLQALYQIHSPSGNEDAMIKFVRDYTLNHVLDTRVDVDFWGNIYITKGCGTGGYPTLCCHLDQIQELHSADFKVVQEGDKLYGYSEANKRREGLGADDKNGIWVCLRCLEKCPKLKIFMGVMEEKGSIGARLASMSFFHNSLYVVEVDSMGSNIVKHVLKEIPCCSEVFLRALEIEKHGFKVVPGKGTDILALKRNGLEVSCINVAVGYYHPHRNDEYTVMTDLQKSLDYVLFIVSHLTQQFPHAYREKANILYSLVVRIKYICKAFLLRKGRLFF